MRRHPPASAAAAAHPRTEAVPEIPRGGAALSTAAAADANAAYTAALESEASGHTHIALERLCEAAELGHAAAATRAATALMTSEGTGRLRRRTTRGAPRATCASPSPPATPTP